MSLDQIKITTPMNDKDINAILEQYYPYIHAMARKLVPRNGLFHQDIIDLEIDEIAQLTLIKVWKILQKERPITNLRSYINHIIYTESIDLLRRQKPHFSQTIDEDGEILYGKILISETEEQEDPEITLEQQEQQEELIQKTLSLIVDLPPRQKDSMIYILKEQAKDIDAIAKISLSYGLDIATLTKPEVPVEMQRLRSLRSIAQKKLRDSFK